MPGFIGAIRRNHALEHAAIAILVNRLGIGARLLGRATVTGFYIYGDVPTKAIDEAANEGLASLQRGNVELAVSPFCGTNIAVAGILAGISAALAIGNKNRLQRLPQVLMAGIGAVLAAQPIGNLLQKYLTTSTDLSNLRIVHVIRRGSGSRTVHKVETGYK